MLNVFEILQVKSAAEERVSGRAAYIGDMCSNCKQNEVIFEGQCYGCALATVVGTPFDER